MTPSGHNEVRMRQKALSFIQKRPSGTTVTARERGRHSFLTDRRASHRRVCSASTTRSAIMFGRLWERRPRRVRVFLRPGRDLITRNNY